MTTKASSIRFLSFEKNSEGFLIKTSNLEFLRVTKKKIQAKNPSTFKKYYKLVDFHHENNSDLKTKKI